MFLSLLFSSFSGAFYVAHFRLCPGLQDTKGISQTGAGPDAPAQDSRYYEDLYSQKAQAVAELEQQLDVERSAHSKRVAFLESECRGGSFSYRCSILRNIKSFVHRSHCIAWLIQLPGEACFVASDANASSIITVLANSLRCILNLNN